MIFQKTALSSTALVILQPGLLMRSAVIQNNGSGYVRLSNDGATSPTTSTGYRLAPGLQYVINTEANATAGHNKIIAIMESGSTTLDIITDDLTSTSPMTAP